MKNTLTDLNNYLFCELERLSDEDLTKEQLDEEIGRARAVSGIATQIIANGRLALDAAQFKNDYAPAPDGKIVLPIFIDQNGR